MMDSDAVLALLQETAEAVINPRFRALADHEIGSKTHPGDLVTVADREAEVLITQALRAAYPHTLVLGEEAYAADARLMEAFHAADHAFTVDPVDGTRNFVHGSPDHAVMAAEIVGGQAVRAWIWQPQHGVAWVAERGAGLYRDSQRVERAAAPDAVADLDVRTSSRRGVGQMLGPAGPMSLTWVSCGIDYPQLAAGSCDALLYRATMPWDHVPGSLMLEEVGGYVGTVDGEPYGPGSRPRGILAAADERVYRELLPYV